MNEAAHALLNVIPLREIVRIDVGMEGDWSGTVVTVWTRDQGFLGFDGVTVSHRFHIPSVELYFEGAWVGLHCYFEDEGTRFFDESSAMEIVQFVETRVPTGPGGRRVGRA